VDLDGDSALVYAAREGHLAAAAVLLECGADTELGGWGAGGARAEGKEAEGGKEEEGGREQEGGGRERRGLPRLCGRPAVAQAAAMGQRRMVRLLLEAGAEPEPPQEASCSWRNVRFVEVVGQ
jgi:ankyrin repeat protein